MTTTDTPRTDAELEKPRDGVYSSFFSMASHARQLERELAEAKAHLAHVAAKLYDYEQHLTQTLMQERAEIAEAEVERLQKELATWDYGTRAKREQEARKKAEAAILRFKNVVRDEWPADQAEEIIKSCLQ